MDDVNKIKNISIIYDKKIINIKILIDESLNAIKYSFYIFKDDKIIKKYYKLKYNSFKFIPVENGIYKVLGFVEYIENGLVLSEKSFSDILKVNNLANKNFEISILGSCVTRDIFTTENDNRSDFLKDYYARSTLNSLFSPKHEQINDVNLKSKFQLQQVYRDFSKDFLNKKFEQYEYLVIDFIDERFNLVRFLDSSIITYSSELQKSKYLDNYNIKDYNIFKNTIETLEQGIDSLVKLIKRNDLQNKVILHEAYWKEGYRTKEGNIKPFDKYIKDNAVKNNKLLSTGYSLLKEKLPSIRTLDLNREFYADESNRWGISPFHYEGFYYEEIFYKLLEIIQSDKI